MEEIVCSLSEKRSEGHQGADLDVQKLQINMVPSSTETSTESQLIVDSVEPKKVDPSAKLLPTVARAVRLSQEFPISDTPAYIYYNDFPQYKAVASGHSRKILSILQNILDILDVKANVLDVPVAKSIEEKFTSIVDANDRLLEKLTMAMDFEEDPKRKAAFLESKADDLVVAVHRRNKTSLEWLKNKNLGEGNDETTEASDGAIRLLSSKNIVRPQALFSRLPDNSHLPFRPLIKSKPNCIVSLSECLPEHLEEMEEYPHPYQPELEAFSSCLSTWEAMLSEEFPTKPLDESYRFVDQLEALQETVNAISVCKYIAVDLEHHSFRSFLGITCLIQISTSDTDYVIDALALRDHLSLLNEVFTDPKIVKVFHGSDSDLMWLQRDFGVYVVNLFDTGIASHLLQYCRFSLSYLLHRFVGVTPNKKYQLADWRMRPLPDELIEYARTDTHYLLHIASRMCQELQDINLLSIAHERGRQLCLKCYTKPVFSRLGYLDLYRQAGGSSFSHRQLYALENLYALRDTIARREDESIHYVLPNHMLKVIAEELPRESSGIFACCNPIPPLVRKYIHDLHKIILDARELPLTDLPLTSAESSDQPNTNQEDNRGSLDHSIIGEFKYALPHDYSHNIASLTTIVHDVSTMEVSETEKPLSLLASTFLPKNSIINSTAMEQDCDEDQQLNNKLLDPNRTLLKKMLTLLKLPCSQPLVPPEPSYVNMSNSVQNGDTDQSLTEATDISTMSDQVVIKLDETTPLRNQSTDELKRPYSAECIRKSSIPNYNNDDIMLLCNEKVNTKSKKRRKTLQHQPQQQQQSSIFQSNENNSICSTETDDLCISVKYEPDSELSEANCSFTTPAHPSACSSGKKNQPKKFRDFRVKRRKHQH
uniref:HRDC domain-containing protein n=1 Tax=Trichobilharzia regenti TaxID=157069 RepID=A0AA85K988_TRIRE|nr:unnamed protein product [Trichobilharzia regenti]